MFRSKPVSLIVLAALLVVALAGCSPASLAGAGFNANLSSNTSAPLQQAGSTPQAAAPANAGITVMGVGQVFGSPDIAHVIVGIETQNNEVKQAVTENNTKMTALISSLKSAGIADKDIQTANYSVSVENPPSPAGVQATPTAIIYHVSNQVQVTVRDLSKLSDILDEAVSTGANSIYGVTFDVSNPGKLEDQARSIAVADAKARAEKLAQLEGVTLGSVITVSEVTNNPVPMYASAYALGKGGGAPIEGGSVQVTVNLQVMYGIK